MTLANWTVPGVFLITRRVVEWRLLLLPDKTVNEILRYCMAYAAQKTGVFVIAYAFLSNHWHMVVYDPHCKRSLFVQEFDAMVARCINKYRKRTDHLWSAEKPNYALLADDAAILEKIIYTICNPVSSGLVERHEEWPGVVTWVEQIGTTEEVSRPKGFFDPKGLMPEVVTLARTIPPSFEHLPIERFRKLLIENVRAREDEIRHERRADGKGFLGVARIMSQDPFSLPHSPAPESDLRPLVATRDKGLREMILDTIKSFHETYRAAYLAFRGGDRQVVFPYGTYAMRVMLNVNCAPAPT